MPPEEPKIKHERRFHYVMGGTHSLEITLAVHAAGRLTPGMIGEKIRRPPARLSQVLARLRDFGVLLQEREGRLLWYRVAPEWELGVIQIADRLAA